MMQNTIVSSASNMVATGYWWMDTIALIMVMSFVGSLFQSLPSLIADIKDRMFGMYKRVKRRISHQQELILKDTAYISSKNNYVYRPEFRNSLHLIKAMEYYLNKQKNVTCVQMDLDNDGTGNNDYIRMKDHSLYYSSIDPVMILDNGITIRYHKTIQSEGEASGSRVMVTTITLESYKPHSYLKEFVQNVYKNYVETYFKRFDNDRELHYYTLDVEKSFSMFGSTEKASNKRELSCWRRYNLEVTRTFDSLFFDEKKNVLKLIDNFLNKSGMYQRDSIPYKMSFLLHGPPGTGKTSFIKALANKTRRHIINVALPLIETNGQLLDIFHNPDIAFFDNWTKREDTIPLDKRIYVLEDIDALSKIVQLRRDLKNTKKASESEDDHSEETDDAKDTKNIKVGPTSELKEKWKETHEKYALQSDELNLGGLLNALDGLMELTGAIVVMTTNCPEKLDPALIRPGRITKRMDLGYMSERSIRKMVEYYFDVPADDLNLRNTNKLTPAKLENICLNSADIHELEKQLQ